MIKMAPRKKGTKRRTWRTALKTAFGKAFKQVLRWFPW